MYKVIHKFIDLKENNHLYCVGDIFPHNEAEINPKRIDELSSNKNRLGIPLIVEIEQQNEEKPKRTRKKKDEE